MRPATGPGLYWDQLCMSALLLTLNIAKVRSKTLFCGILHYALKVVRGSLKIVREFEIQWIPIHKATQWTSKCIRRFINGGEVDLLRKAPQSSVSPKARLSRHSACLYWKKRFAPTPCRPAERCPQGTWRRLLSVAQGPRCCLAFHVGLSIVPWDRTPSCWCRRPTCMGMMPPPNLPRHHIPCPMQASAFPSMPGTFGRTSSPLHAARICCCVANCKRWWCKGGMHSGFHMWCKGRRGYLGRSSRSRWSCPLLIVLCLWWVWQSATGR